MLNESFLALLIVKSHLDGFDIPYLDSLAKLIYVNQYELLTAV